ncbi:MAG: acyl carrier protein [Bifidobacteriaceae bacterium]|jgi:acyl carrier protein|nr:acyl carrier protein [Bifidobacteriaceae bacterium]
MALNPDEILEGLAEIVAEEGELDAAQVTPGKSFADDLLIDSLTMMTIVTLAEDKFEVEIPDAAVKDLATVQDAVDFIAAAAA